MLLKKYFAITSKVVPFCTIKKQKKYIVSFVKKYCKQISSATRTKQNRLMLLSKSAVFWQEKVVVN